MQVRFVFIKCQISLETPIGSSVILTSRGLEDWGQILARSTTSLFQWNQKQAKHDLRFLIQKKGLKKLSPKNTEITKQILWRSTTTKFQWNQCWIIIQPNNSRGSLSFVLYLGKYWRNNKECLIIWQRVIEGDLLREEM